MRNVLSRQVPDLAAKHAEHVLAGVLARSGITRSQIATWILHAGGRDVLQAISARLGLPAGALDFSASILRTHGNLSSAFVYFVLAAALSGGAPGGYWWLSSFGAGFSSHGTLLEVE